jgi:hypothetical protein
LQDFASNAQRAPADQERILWTFYGKFSRIAALSAVEYQNCGFSAGGFGGMSEENPDVLHRDDHPGLEFLTLEPSLHRAALAP